MQSTQRSNSQPKSSKRIRRLTLLVLLLIASLFILLNRQWILDSIDVASYRPSGEMSAIVKRASLNETGTFMFYATKPEIDDSDEFNKNCERREEGTAILGCYDNDRIYIYNVKDARLDGIREVTAAHEMLHAVYQRMSDGEREAVDALVEAEYTKLSNDPRFSDRMAFYARTEPGERDNELHSIIGTEVDSISAELEKHYAKYFVDRAKVLALFKGYNNVFVEIDTQAKALSAQLDALSDKIDTEMADYNNAVKSLNEDIQDFNNRADSGSFTSQAAFNNERLALVRRVEDVATQRATIDSDLQRYEQLRVSYNDIVTTSNNLYKSIDSSLVPAPSV